MIDNIDPQYLNPEPMIQAKCQEMADKICATHDLKSAIEVLSESPFFTGGVRFQQGEHPALALVTGDEVILRGFRNRRPLS